MTHDPDEAPRVVYPYTRPTPAEQQARAAACVARMQTRRSIRAFSPDPVPRALIATAIQAAGTAPSGAHQQPWTFVAVQDARLKREIRQAAEAEEHRSYEGGRMPDAWKAELAPLGTTWRKPYLEVAPWLVVLFAQKHGFHDDGRQRKHYYVRESVGIAAGMFLSAVHEMGLVSLTHTPSPMAFLSRLLDRPSHEQPFLLMPVGFPADGVTVPDLTRKSLDAIAIWR